MRFICGVKTRCRLKLLGGSGVPCYMFKFQNNDPLLIIETTFMSCKAAILRGGDLSGLDNLEFTIGLSDCHIFSGIHDRIAIDTRSFTRISTAAFGCDMGAALQMSLGLL